MTEMTDKAKKSKVAAAAVDIIRFRLGAILAAGDDVEEAKMPAEALSVLERLMTELSDKDLAAARGAAELITRFAKPSCKQCWGRGVVKRSVNWVSSWVVCDCVKLPHTKEETPGVAPIQTVSKADRDRLTEARVILGRAREAQRQACASFDEKIASVEKDLADFFEKKSKIEGAIAEQQSLLEEAQRNLTDAEEIGTKAQGEAEALAEEIGLVVQGILSHEKISSHELLSYTQYKLHRMFVAEDVVASQRDRLVMERTHAQDATTRRAALTAELEALTQTNSATLARLEQLRSERARIARHHEPKIEKAERRVRRLAFLAGEEIAAA